LIEIVENSLIETKQNLSIFKLLYYPEVTHDLLLAGLCAYRKQSPAKAVRRLSVVRVADPVK
jgi:hypothetical protein